MSRKSKKPAAKSLSVILTEDLYDKIHRIADAQDRSAAAVVRRLIAALPEPVSAEAS